MAVNIYNVIRNPILTEKSSQLINDLQKITFEVDPQANKAMVCEALEKLFRVRVKNVRISIRKGKTKTVKRMKTTGPLSKRAIVTLKDQQSFDILAQLVTGRVIGGNPADSGVTTTTQE